MTTEYEYRRIDGSTSIKKRMDLVREFNRDPNIFIFLISTKYVKSRVLRHHMSEILILLIHRKCHGNLLFIILFQFSQN